MHDHPPSASIRITKGEPYGRTLNTTGLTQGTVNLTVEPIGTFFYPTVRLLDLRFSKSLRVGNSKLEGLFDIFNVTNNGAFYLLEIGANQTFSPLFGQGRQRQTPRAAQLSARLPERMDSASPFFRPRLRNRLMKRATTPPNSR